MGNTSLEAGLIESGWLALALGRDYGEEEE